MVNAPGEYLMLELLTPKGQDGQLSNSLSVQATIVQCETAKTAGCFSEMAVQIGSTVFRADKNGNYLNGNPLQATGKVELVDGSIDAFEGKLYIEHPLLRVVINEAFTQKNFVEFSIEPKLDFTSDSSGILSSGCKDCSDGVCLCTNWKIAPTEPCRISAGHDKDRPYQSCGFSNVEPAELKDELHKEVTELKAVQSSTAFTEALAGCKATLASLMPPAPSAALSKLAEELSKDCAVDSAEHSPDSKPMLEKIFCDAAEQSIDPATPEEAACATVELCKTQGFLPALLNGEACTATTLIDV